MYLINTRRRVEMIHRDIEKSLDLTRVEIHRQHPRNPGGGEEIRHELGGDRHPRLIFPILPCVSEKRDHRSDALRAGSLRRVHHDEEFHQVFVGRRAGRLEDKQIATSDIFIDPDKRLPIGKTLHVGHARFHFEQLANTLRQLRVGAPG